MDDEMESFLPHLKPGVSAQKRSSKPMRNGWGGQRKCRLEAREEVSWEDSASDSRISTGSPRKTARDRTKGFCSTPYSMTLWRRLWEGCGNVKVSLFVLVRAYRFVTERKNGDCFARKSLVENGCWKTWKLLKLCPFGLSSWPKIMIGEQLQPVSGITSKCNRCPVLEQNKRTTGSPSTSKSEAACSFWQAIYLFDSVATVRSILRVFF